MSQIIRVGAKYLNLATLGHVEVSDSRDGLAAGERPPVATAYTLGGRVRLTGDDARELVRLLDHYADVEAMYRGVSAQDAAACALAAGTWPEEGDEALGSPGAAEGVTR